MHDIRLIREAPEAFDSSLARRGLAPAAASVLALDETRRSRIHAAEQALAERNAASRSVGEAKARGDEAEFARLRGLVAEAKTRIAALEEEARVADRALTDLLAEIPNLPAEDVPDGPDETANVEVKRWGDPRESGFTAREHFDVPAVRAGFDLEAGARLSGARFMVLRGAVARLHRALAQFMIDLHVSRHGLAEIWTPALVRDEAMFGTGQLPKFGEDSYRTTGGHWLIPTSEVTLTNLAAGQMAEGGALPLRMVAHTHCFRSEAGAAGRDTTGILRQHQFEKVEMVTICRPEESEAEHERMTGCAEAVLEALDLPYRRVVLCAGDMGFGARKTYDLEVWLPGQGAYREISSLSNCGDFQARRMNARYRPEPEARPDFVHTLNGSGLAVGRALIAVIENGQEADGSVSLPAALGPWLGGATRIDPEGRLA